MVRKFLSLLFVLGISVLGIHLGEIATQKYVVEVAEAKTSGLKKDGEGREKRYKNLELFQKVLHFVESNYVDQVDNKDLIHGAIKGMMGTLDPHSNFLPEKIFTDMKVDTSGKFGGLGIEIGMRDGVLTVVAPIEDTPAWKAGLKPGDRIVKIDGKSTKGMTLTEAVSHMRGKRGTKVTISVYRATLEKIRDIAIVREEIKLRSVKSAKLESGYLYVRLTSFNENASKDVRRAIKKFEKEGGKLKGLVFDLRTNPGGLLDQAVDVASLFIDHGVVVSTVGRNRDQKELKHAKKGSARSDFPVAILVNSSTASAAEIVAGALQDHGRAVIMGQPTFGKGSVQTVIDLGQNVGLKLTVSRYYTPKGRSIQEKGVMPDILLDEYDPQLLAKAKLERESVREKDLPGHIREDGDSSDFTAEELKAIGKKKEDKVEDESLAFKPQRYQAKDDFQVKEALNYLKSYEIFKKLKKYDKSASRDEEDDGDSVASR